MRPSSHHLLHLFMFEISTFWVVLSWSSQLVNAVTAAAGSMGSGDAAIKASAGAVLGLATMQAGFTCLYIALLSLVGERICERMRNALFSSLIRQDIVFFDQRKSGELMDRLTADVDTFRSAFKQVCHLPCAIPYSGCTKPENRISADGWLVGRWYRRGCETRPRPVAPWYQCSWSHTTLLAG